MKRLIFLFFILITMSCSDNPESYIEHINGYWEIEKVVLADGSEKEYNYNETVDYFNISDSLFGYRKKLKPNFEGKYTTSKSSESFKIVIENDSLNVYYKTPFDSWKETILHASEDKLKVINSSKNVYLYKRFIPINIE